MVILLVLFFVQYPMVHKQTLLVILPTENCECFMLRCCTQSVIIITLSLPVSFDVTVILVNSKKIHGLMTFRSYRVVLSAYSATFPFLFKFSWLSASVGSVLRYWDLGGAMLVSSCCSANRSLWLSCLTFNTLEMRFPTR